MKWIAFFISLISAGLMGKEITFEPARLDQAEFLTDLGLRSNAVYQYRSVSDEEARAVFVVKEWHIEEGIVRLMKDRRKIVGFYGLTCEQGINKLSHFFLEPESIGKGYGKILFLEAMRAAKEELKWEMLEWESDPHAAWFYEKMGAERIGENPCPLNPLYKAPVFMYRLIRGD